MDQGDEMEYFDTKQIVLETTLRLQALNLIRLSAGNISCRTQDGLVAITPSGVPYDQMKSSDIVIIDLEGRIVDAEEGRTPSSEYLLHTTILKHLPEVQAVIHAHPIYSITFAALGRELPIICIELLIPGGPIPVAPYATPGTSAVGENVVRIFLERPELKGCLQKNHGLATIGVSLEEALSHAVDIETGAQIYHQALQIGEPETIPQADVDMLRKKYDLIADRSPRSEF
jgi:ribulose-5-phosphate 4-epimerase/fuculose-1-phosphate aldolase